MKFFSLIIVILLSCCSAVAQKTDSTKKQFLAVMSLTEKYKNEKNWTDADNKIIGEHFQHLVKYKNEGVIILAGRTSYETNSPDLMGLIIFYANNEAEALKFIQSDPAVKNNIMTLRVHPYRVSINKCE